MPIDLHGPGMWYATRAAGLVTLLLLTASVLLGVMTAGRFSSDRWPRFLTAERPAALLVGGYFGAWLLAEAAWRVPMCHAALKAAGGAMGAGMVIVLPVSSCGLAETARVVRYLADENAGQCGPCMFGLPALADAMADLAYQGGRGRALERVASLAGLVAGRGACRHPDGAVQLVRSALRTFEADALWHEHRGPCPGVARAPLLPVPGDADWDWT